MTTPTVPPVPCPLCDLGEVPKLHPDLCTSCPANCDEGQVDTGACGDPDCCGPRFYKCWTCDGLGRVQVL